MVAMTGKRVPAFSDYADFDMYWTMTENGAKRVAADVCLVETLNEVVWANWSLLDAAIVGGKADAARLLAEAGICSRLGTDLGSCMVNTVEEKKGESYGRNHVRLVVDEPALIAAVVAGVDIKTLRVDVKQVIVDKLVAHSKQEDRDFEALTLLDIAVFGGDVRIAAWLRDLGCKYTLGEESTAGPHSHMCIFTDDWGETFVIPWPMQTHGQHIRSPECLSGMVKACQPIHDPMALGELPSHTVGDCTTKVER